MTNKLEIYVDRLKVEGENLIDLELLPTSLEVDEPELVFDAPVRVSGKAYIASDDLILNLNVRTTAVVPCAICNESVELAITMDGFYHTEKLTNIKHGRFDATPSIRESILLEVPQFVECGGKSCPKRTLIGKYLTQNEAQFPFAELESGEN